MKLKNLKFNIPLNYNVVLFKNINNNNSNLVILNDSCIIRLKLEKNIKINKFTNNIEFKNVFLKKNFYSKNKIFYFLNKLNMYFYIKIKFKGKGYKIKFYKKKIIYNFGRSHKSIMLNKNIFVKKIQKNKFIIMNNNFEKIKKIGETITGIKKLDFFTLRGLRLARQIIIKRKGRKGSFV